MGTAAVRHELHVLGAATAPPPRAAFVSGLEARLADLIHTSSDGDVLPEVELSPVTASARPRRLLTTVAAASLAIVLVSGLVVSSRIARIPLEEVHTAADGAKPYAGHRGLGSDYVDRSWGDEAVVDAGAKADDDDDVRSQSPPVDRRGSTSPAPGSSPPAPPSQSGLQAPSTASNASSTAAPSRSAAARREAAPLALSATGSAARVFLEWERYEGENFAAYLVLRANAPDQPDEPDQSGRTLMLLRIENRDMVSHQDTPKVGSAPRYRVVVVDQMGAVVARSAVVEPELPFAANAAGVGVVGAL